MPPWRENYEEKNNDNNSIERSTFFSLDTSCGCSLPACPPPGLLACLQACLSSPRMSPSCWSSSVSPHLFGQLSLKFLVSSLPSQILCFFSDSTPKMPTIVSKLASPLVWSTVAIFEAAACSPCLPACVVDCQQKLR